MVLTAVVFKSHATVEFYDSFNYLPTGVQLATAASPTWVAYTGGGVHPTNNSGSLVYPGLQTASGDNSVLFNGSGAAGIAARNLTHAYNIGNSSTLYYSLTLNVSNISLADWGNTAANFMSGSFLLGFNQKLQNGTALAQADVAAPLLIRTGDPNNVSGTANDFQQYQLGVGVTATTANRTFDANHNYNPGDTLFLVLSYTFNPGTADDVAKLYVNPIPGSLESANTPVVITTNGAVDVTSNQLQSFFLRNNSVEPANTIIDNLRVGTAWEEVTPSGPSGPPVVASMNSIINNGAANSIGLCFDREVTLPSATNLLNYTVHNVNAGTVNVTNVVLHPNNRSVELILALPVAEFFSVDVTNVMDVASNAIASKTSGFLSDHSSTTIGTPGNPSTASQVYTCRGDSFDVSAGGSGIGAFADHFHFIYQTVSGDFDTRARLTGLGFANPSSQAGLMARATLAADSATIQTYFTPTQGVNLIGADVRPASGSNTTGFAIGPPPSADSFGWLRLTGTNGVFTAYHGTNGVDWIVTGVTTQAFYTNLLVGLAVSSHTNGVATTASFTDFSLQGARPGDGFRPQLISSLNGTNLMLAWTRSPKQDFAVEVATNLSNSAGTNLWSLLLLPIMQDGTNAAARLMQIPRALIDQPLFLRLAKVFKVIPQNPLSISPGIILSPENQYLSSAPGTANSLCNSSAFTVISSTAYAQTSAQIIAPSSTVVTFTTADSDTSVDTVLQVRRLVSGTCDDNALSDRKAQVLMTMTPSTTTLVTNSFSLIVAVKTNAPSPYTSRSLIKVKINY